MNELHCKEWVQALVGEISRASSGQVQVWLSVMCMKFQVKCNTGSHTFSREPDFSENEKVGREKGSQWGVPVHGGCGIPPFAVASMENENWRMGLL